MKNEIAYNHRSVVTSLLNTRGDLSLIEQDLALEAQIERETSDWVPIWIDIGHSVRSSRLEATAFRAITDDGVLLWYVCHDRKRKGYHSLASTALGAFEDAADKWHKRREIKRNWDQLKSLQRDIFLGRVSLVVTLEDAHASGLCVLGIKGFMRRFGIAGRRQISGRLAALLMYFEPQVGFALYQAAASKGVLPNVRPRAARQPDPVGV